MVEAEVIAASKDKDENPDGYRTQMGQDIADLAADINRIVNMTGISVEDLLRIHHEWLHTWKHHVG